MNVNEAYAQAIARRTYNRPLDMNDPVEFESWEDTVQRVVNHQRWLWQRALDTSLNTEQETELDELSSLMIEKRACLAGRTMWLGGTPKSREVECSMFNCAFTGIQTVYDIVDVFWLLLNGCGVGFRPKPGNLFGFASRIPNIHIEYDPEKSPSHRGDPDNWEYYDTSLHRWSLGVGDSAAGWAKTVGKLFAGKHPRCKDLVIDLTDVRGPGERLSGYGWICHGAAPFAMALSRIVEDLNRASGRPLSYGELHDCANNLGTVLSTRRSAQIALYNYDGGPGTLDFMEFKDSMDEPGGPWWRGQSNNTIQYKQCPSLVELQLTLEKMHSSGRGEPGIRNLGEARRRAPWSDGTNPCAEILLPDKGFCNLVDVNVAHPEHLHNHRELRRTIQLMARANYRQTLVDLRDGVLQEAWHINNQNLRLCGVGLTGIRQHPEHEDRETIHGWRSAARFHAGLMADELNTQRPALITTVKPSGTLAKVMGCTSGIHAPLAEHMFYRVNFMKDDPTLGALADAGYEVTVNPYDPDNGRLVKFPAHFPGADDLADESAIDQLDLYLIYQQEWADHNTSITVYYEEHEIPEISRWLHRNWDQGFVSVSFLPRKVKAYKYLPQEAVTKQDFDAYVATLSPLSLTSGGRMYTEEEVNNGNCESGACPVR